MTGQYAKLLGIALCLGAWAYASELEKIVPTHKETQQGNGLCMLDLLHELAKLSENILGPEERSLVLEKIEELASGEMVDRLDEEGYTPLYYAVIGNNTAAATVLLNQGADLDNLSHTNYQEYLSQDGYETMREIIEPHRGDNDNNRQEVPRRAQAHLPCTIRVFGKTFVIPYRTVQDFEESMQQFFADASAHPERYFL